MDPAARLTSSADRAKGRCLEREASVVEAELHDERLDGALTLIRIAVPDRLAQLGADGELRQVAEDALTAMPERDVIAEQQRGVMHLGGGDSVEDDAEHAAAEPAGVLGGRGPLVT